MKAILLDLYETLITERENEENILDFGTPECHSPASILGLSEASFEREWSLRRSDRMNGVFLDYITVLNDICQKNNLDVDHSILRKLNEKRIEAKRHPYQKINHEIMNTLREIKRKGIKIALVSNCSAEETEFLFSSPIYSLIDEIILSYQVGVSKPNKEIYLLACERLKIRPSESIFIGDGGANELIGAENAGIKAYRAKWFYNRQDRDEKFPSIEKPVDLIDIVSTATSLN